MEPDNDQKSNANNGLITKIWGPPSWKFLHCVTYGYPVNPTAENKKSYKEYFILIGAILPCGACRTSYTHFINNGDTELTDKVMENRESLTSWFYKIHQKVNNKLKMDYGATLVNVTAKYENYRAKDKSSKNQCGGATKKKIYKLVR